MMGTGKLRDPKVMSWIESEEVLAICILSSLGSSGVEITVTGSETAVPMVKLLSASEVRVLRKLILVVAGDASALTPV